jgi:hypothetical protein
VIVSVFFFLLWRSHSLLLDNMSLFISCDNTAVYLLKVYHSVFLVSVPLFISLWTSQYSCIFLEACRQVALLLCCDCIKSRCYCAEIVSRRAVIVQWLYQAALLLCCDLIKSRCYCAVIVSSCCLILSHIWSVSATAVHFYRIHTHAQHASTLGLALST